MAGKTAILSLKIIGDATGAQKAAATAKKEISGLEKAVAGAKKGLALAGGAAGVALVAGLDSAMKADGANRQLAASMGLSPEDAKKAGALSGNLYKNAYGDSLEQVNGTIAGVASTLTTFAANGGADVERLTKKALDLAATFPEVGDGVSTAGILMKTGLAKNADEAYDLMAASLQKVPKAMQAELFPVMDEYSKHFADLGIDGTTAFGIMAEASKGGAIAMDKTGDALKEFTIRATDGSVATKAAYESIGLDAEEMARKIAAGGPQAQEAFAKTVAGLQGIEDPAKQAQAAIGLFGTPLEDLGTAKIPEFLGAIDPMGDKFDSVAGAADRMGQTINGGPSVALESLKRTAMDSFAQIGAAALPVLEPIIATLSQYAPVLGPLAVAVAGFAAVVWTVNAAMAAWNAIQLVGKAAVLASAGAQWVWNTAMSANPIGVVILLIAGLVAGLVWAYQNVGWFKDAMNAMGAVAVAVWQWVVDGINNVLRWINDLLAPVGGIEGALRIMGDAGKAALDGIVGGIQNAIKWVQDAIGWFESLFGAKNKAASAGDGGGAMGLSLATVTNAGAQLAPATYGFGAAAAPAGFGASFGATAGALASGGSGAFRSAAPTIIHNTYQIDVKAGPGTDKAAIGKEIAGYIRTYERSTGKVNR